MGLGGSRVSPWWVQGASRVEPVHRVGAGVIEEWVWRGHWRGSRSEPGQRQGAGLEVEVYPAWTLGRIQGRLSADPEGTYGCRDPGCTLGVGVQSSCDKGIQGETTRQPGH